jgi:hypothetical protein
MKTYVKIFGPPLGEALDELQRIAAEMPKVSHYHMLSGYEGAPPFPTSMVAAGWTPTGEPTIQYPVASLPEDRLSQVPSGLPTGAGVQKTMHPALSRSGHTLGEYDFFFEWVEEPTWQQMRDLISQIDKAFARLGCKYTITTK